MRHDGRARATARALTAQDDDSSELRRSSAGRRRFAAEDAADGFDDDFETVRPSASGSAAAREFESAQDQQDEQGSSRAQGQKGPSLKFRAVAMLSRREYSRQEIAARLQAYAPDPSAIPALLDELERDGWQSDERYARSVLNQRAARQGTRRLVGDLRRQGIADDLIEPLAEDLRASEYERALEVWRKRFESREPPSTPKEYARQARFLMARGFEGNVVSKVLKRAQAAAGSDEYEVFDDGALD